MARELCAQTPVESDHGVIGMNLYRRAWHFRHQRSKRERSRLAAVLVPGNFCAQAEDAAAKAAIDVAKHAGSAVGNERVELADGVGAEEPGTRLPAIGRLVTQFPPG